MPSVQGAGETIVGRCLRRNDAVVSMSGNSSSWTGIDELGVVRNRMARLPMTLWGCKFRDDLAAYVASLRARLKTG